MKKFGDLRKGDSVFMVSSDWVFHSFKVLDIKYGGGGDIKLTLDNAALSGYYPKNQVSSSNSLWSDKEGALSYALGIAKKERDYLSNKIDEMILKYDKIEKFIGKYERC